MLQITGCNAAAWDGVGCEFNPSQQKFSFIIDVTITSAAPVKGTLDLLADLIAVVETIDDNGVMTKLLQPLYKARRILRDQKPENDPVACDSLDKFIEMVDLEATQLRLDATLVSRPVHPRHPRNQSHPRLPHPVTPTETRPQHPGPPLLPIDYPSVRPQANARVTAAAAAVSNGKE